MPATEALRRSLKARPRVHRILVADDDEGVRDLVILALSAQGFDVVSASDGGEVLDHVGGVVLGEEEIDLFVTDVRMPVFSGLDTLAAVRASGLDVPAIIITGLGDEWVRNEAGRLNAIVIQKPLDIDRLVTSVRALLTVDLPRRQSE